MQFAASFLPTEMPHYWETVATFANKCCADGIGVSPESTKLLMENLLVLDSSSFSSDTKLMKELIAMPYGSSKTQLGIPLIPHQSLCQLCNGKLLLKGDRPSGISLYTMTYGTVSGTHYHKYCTNYRKGCKFTQFYGYCKLGASENGRYDDKWMDLPFFISSQETGFETSMLKRFDAELLLGQISYKQRADIYNVYNGYDITKKYSSSVKKPSGTNATHGSHVQRQQLDRRRLETAHLKYASLTLAQHYPEVTKLSSVSVGAEITDSLLEIAPALFNAFKQKYTAHSCSYPGCGKVLILDGNMKNHRDVCFAKDAGFIEFEGLDGSIKTGCPETPAFKNRYCNNHKPQLCDLKCFEEKDELLDFQTGPELRSKQKGLSKDSLTGEPIAEMILAKKTTRKQAYYQVLWLGQPQCNATWEPCSSLPPELIEDYETGIAREAAVETKFAYGHVVNTVTISKTEAHGEKRKRQERPCVENLQGIFKATTEQDDYIIKCKTEKDRSITLNHKTAGILAGIWPCGIVTFISELFVSESKSQVYGHLHELLRSSPEMASNLRYVCYDDGCHLRKYARNPCRSSQTSTAKILSEINIVIDKMHMAGHVDQWCKTYCDPNLYDDLKPVDSEICEQTFSWLSRYGKMTQRMSRHTFIFFLLYIVELHNKREVEKLQRSGFL